ncbi:MAG: carboxypeptidase regulatory-like domain-containing protein [Planctomycetes bacterium]|nr:carboxypeptidase regulatory-like domain-containing protein [Planctomycetota bacterium]
MDRTRRLAWLGCGVALAVLLLLLWWAGELGRSEGVLERTQELELTRENDAKLATSARAQRAEVAREEDAAAPRATVPQPAALRAAEPRGRGALEVRLVDAEGFPVPGARVRASPDPGTSADELLRVDDRAGERELATDARGIARFEDLESGPWRLEAEGDSRTSRGPLRAAERAVVAAHRLELCWLQFSEGPGLVAVHVRDQDGQPCAGVAVELRGAGARIPSEQSLRAQAQTDARGIAEVDLHGLERALLIARDAEGRVGCTSLPERPHLALAQELGYAAIALGPACRLSGRVITSGSPVRGGFVVAQLVTRGEPYYARFALEQRCAIEEGGYRFEGLPPGTYHLDVHAVGPWRCDWPRASGVQDSLAPEPLVLSAGEARSFDVQLASAATLTGIVRDEAGEPLAGVHVRATLVPRTTNFVEGVEIDGAPLWRLEDGDGRACTANAAAQRTTTTDASGTWRLEGLAPGRQRLELFAAGWERMLVPSVEILGGASQRFEHQLRRAGVIQGTIGDRGTVSVRAVGGERALQSSLVGAPGAFVFDGLAPGRYLVQAAVERPLQVEALVQAGAVSWVDLRPEATLAVRGQLRREGVGVPELDVELLGRHATSDAEGRFELAVLWSGAVAFADVSLVVRDGALALHHVVQLQDRGLACELAPLDLPTGLLILRAREPNGAPTRARITYASAEQRLPGFTLRAECSPAEDLVLRGLPSGARLEAQFESGARLVIDPLEIPPGPLVLEEPPSGRVRLRCVDAQDRPLPARRVALFPDQAITASRHRGIGDAEGVCELRGVPLGTWRAGFETGGWNPLPSEEQLVRLEVRAGERTEVLLRYAR